jgi:hypothetical protein
MEQQISAKIKTLASVPNSKKAAQLLISNWELNNVPVGSGTLDQREQ